MRHRTRHVKAVARYASPMLYLASQSPRRLELLAQLGYRPGILSLDVPEVRAPDEPAADYVRRVAREKAGAGLLKVMATPGALVLGADTEVILDGEVFGKPAGRDEAAAMLVRLAGRRHQVITSVALVSAAREWQVESISTVSVAALDEAALAAYLDTGEWQGKAGAYAIQGRFAAHVAHLEGSFSGVMGLPLHETARLLQAAGVQP
jgi:septum formation protein